MDGAFGTPRVSAADPIERIAEAAKRLGLNVWTLRSRAASLGLTSGLPAGRPKKGEVAGLRRSEWNRCGGAWPRGPKTAKVSREGCRWTPEENARLTDLWGVIDPDELCVSLRRAWDAIAQHAVRELKLPRGLPKGMVSIADAARALGYDPTATLDLAARNNVPVRYHPCPGRLKGHRNGKPGPGCLRCVSLDELREAADRETRETETVHAAAVRRGMQDVVLRRWLRAAGLMPPKQTPRRTVRVLTVEIDRVVAARRGAV